MCNLLVTSVTGSILLKLQRLCHLYLLYSECKFLFNFSYVLWCLCTSVSVITHMPCHTHVEVIGRFQELLPSFYLGSQRSNSAQVIKLSALSFLFPLCRILTAIWSIWFLIFLLWLEKLKYWRNNCSLQRIAYTQFLHSLTLLGIKNYPFSFLWDVIKYTSISSSFIL